MFRVQKIISIAVLVASVFLVSGCSENVSGQEIITKSDLTVASSKIILQNTIDKMKENDFELLMKYMGTGDYYVLPESSTIKVLTFEGVYVKCLVLDGRKNVGSEFWTFKEHLSIETDQKPIIK